MSPSEWLGRLAAYVASATILCLPAIWNGFPIVFDDVGGYLERWPAQSLWLGRSAAYGLLLWVTAPAWWVPVLLLQAMVTTWIIERALVILGDSRSPGILLAVVAGLSAMTGVALFVSTVMPDAWAAPAVLALHLMAWHADALTRREQMTMTAIIAFAGASHMAILGLLAALSLLHAAAFVARRLLRVTPSGVVFAGAAAWAGLILLLGVNLLVAGRLALTPGGDVIIFSRLVADGHVGKVLAEECPRNDWQLCDYKNSLPVYSEDFLYDTDSPLPKIGGWNDPRTRQEMASIIARSFLTQPVEHIGTAIALTARQLVSVDVTRNMRRVNSWHTKWMIDLHAPWLAAAHDAGRQQRGEADLSAWSRQVIGPVSIAATFALPAIAVLLWRRGHRREAVLPGLMFLALIGNAFLCAVVAGAYDRYQARLVWVAPLAIALAVAALRRRDALTAQAA